MTSRSQPFSVRKRSMSATRASACVPLDVVGFTRVPSRRFTQRWSNTASIGDDALELGGDRGQVLLLEHAGGAGGLEGVGADRVPAAEDEVVELGEGHELLDPGVAVVLALAEADVGELAERADGGGVAGPGGQDAGDEGGGHGAHAGGEHPEAAGGGSDVDWFAHGPTLTTTERTLHSVQKD